MSRFFLVILLTLEIGNVNSQTLVGKGTSESNDLNIIRKFSESYKPKPDKGKTVAVIPILSESLKSSLLVSYTEDSSQVNKYLTLILLKLYKSHLKCCNQSYSYNTKDGINSKKQPILYYYFRYNKLSNQDVFEIGSYLPYDLVQKDKNLLLFNPIEKEVNQIKNLKK